MQSRYVGAVRLFPMVETVRSRNLFMMSTSFSVNAQKGVGGTMSVVDVGSGAPECSAALIMVAAVWLMETGDFGGGGALKSMVVSNGVVDVRST